MSTAKKNATKPATIVDVAAAADVSIGTVSRYLNDLPVRAENRERIIQAIDGLGYRRSKLASSMKAASTGVIGILVPNYDKFHSDLITKLTEELRKSGLLSLTLCHDNTAQTVEDALEFFRTYRVDVLVMGGSESHVESLRALIARGTPVVTYDNPQIDLELDSVEVDNQGASALAVRYLIEAGHRDVGIITGNDTHETARARLAGFHSEMAAQGLPVTPHMVENGDWTRVGGRAAFARMVSGNKKPPTALFCANHRMAIGAMEQAKSHGFELPRDLSIVSFDDVEAFRLMTPSVSAIAQPIETIATNLARLVQARAKSKKQANVVPQRVILACNLMARDSVVAPSLSKINTPDEGPHNGRT